MIETEIVILKLPNSTNSGGLAIFSRRCQQHVIQQYRSVQNYKCYKLKVKGDIHVKESSF